MPLRSLAMRIGHLLAVVLLVSVGATILVELTPGDVSYAIGGENASAEEIAAIRYELGLERPLVERYASWLRSAVQGDLGRSHRTHQPVIEAIGDRLPVTFELATLAMVLALAIAVPTALYCAQAHGRRADRVVSATAFFGLSTPVFLSALLLVYLFSVRWGVLPVSGWVPFGHDPVENLRHAALPVVALVLYEAPILIRVLRFELLSTLREDFITCARAKGLPRRYILFRHALRPSSTSLVTVAGVSLANLLGGTIILENIFGVPGLGAYLVDAIFSRDLIVVQGTVVVIALIYVVLNLAVELLYFWLDPRIRRSALSG